MGRSSTCARTHRQRYPTPPTSAPHRPRCRSSNDGSQQRYQLSFLSTRPRDTQCGCQDRAPIGAGLGRVLVERHRWAGRGCLKCHRCKPLPSPSRSLPSVPSSRLSSRSVGGSMALSRLITAARHTTRCLMRQASETMRHPGGRGTGTFGALLWLRPAAALVLSSTRPPPEPAPETFDIEG